MKHVLVINDLSYVGRAALMANIPIISSYGHQVIPCPTVLLTRHTGFDSLKVHHLDDFFEDTINDLIEHDQIIDAILIGYLDGKHQIGPIMKLLDYYPNAYVFVDPICADNGKFYHGKDQDYVESLIPLIQRADLIKPNITEALALCNMPLDTPVNETILNECIKTLQMITKGNIVLTGLHQDDKIKNILIEHEKIAINENEYIDCYYPGTGDVFDSVLLGSLLNGYSLSRSIKNSTKIVYQIVNNALEKSLIPVFGCEIESFICKHY